MPRAQQVLAIDEGLACQEGQRLGRDLDDPLPLEAPSRDEVAGQLAVGRIIRAQRKQLVEAGLAHLLLQNDGGRSIFLSVRRSRDRPARPPAFRPPWSAALAG